MNHHATDALVSLDSTTLVARAQSGDGAAFEELYRRYCPSVLRRLTHLLGPDATVQDLAQETFVQAFRSLGRVRECFGGWVLRIATNLARSHYRDGRRRFWRLWVKPEAADEHPANARSVDETYPALRLVHRALAELSPALREAVVLFELEGLSLAELAETLDIPPNTAASRVRRGRERLRAALEALLGNGASGESFALDARIALCGSDPR